jgi:hypothetical protein
MLPVILSLYAAIYVLRLTHFAIKKYLISSRAIGKIPREFCATEKDAHIYITKSCLAYYINLSEIYVVTSEHLETFILGEYASSN